MKCIFSLAVFQGLILWPYLFFYAFYSAQRAIFWFLDVGACFSCWPQAPHAEVCEGEGLSQEQSYTPRGSLCSDRWGAPASSTRPQGNQPQRERGSINLWFSSFHFSLCSGTHWENNETRQSGRNALEDTCFIYNCFLSSSERLEKASLSRILTREHSLCP